MMLTRPILDPVDAARAPWLAHALDSFGLREAPGPADNPTIFDWARRLGVAAIYRHDAQAWCALAVSSWLRMALEADAIEDWRDRLPAGVACLRARAYERWGIAGPLIPGAIVVLERSDGGRHMGLLWHREPGRLRIYGGNQGNQVQISGWDPKAITATRWPAWAPLPGR